MNKEKLVEERTEKLDLSIGKIWESRQFRVFIDAMRILSLIVAVVAIWYLYKEIELLKILGGDACKYCMNKTGATCFVSDISFG